MADKRKFSVFRKLLGEKHRMSLLYQSKILIYFRNRLDSITFLTTVIFG